MNAVIIPVRLDSSRFPDKALAEFNGKPLIWHTIQNAMDSSADEIIVATSDLGVGSVLNDLGLNVECIITPDAKSGTARICHLYNELTRRRHRYIVNLQVDEPMVFGSSIDRVFDQIRQSAVATLVTRCCDEEYYNPNTVKVVFNSNHKALYFSRSPIPYRGVDRAYKHIGVYGYHCFMLNVLSTLDHGFGTEDLEQLGWLNAGLDIQVIVDDSLKDSISINGELDARAFQHYLDSTTKAEV